ncbi:sortase [Streptomyces sp. V4I8]|uniref:sortase n=1 Tax=Streptomyces sp. V4I8 TaxID=3156469 RepID=UPI00351662A3
MAVTVGLALGGYTAWLVWGTSPQPSQAEQARTAQVEKDLRRRAPSPHAGPDTPAVMRIPALGRRWAYRVYNGTTAKQLNKGLGHYRSTAGPGQVGNYVVAGHRSSNSGFAPFAELPDRIKRGSRLIVTAATGRYTYTVTKTQRVTPDAVRVLRSDQGRGADPQKRLITLITCTPRYGSTGRFIVYGHLISHQGPK